MKKCPKCEFNYINDNEELCSLCKKDNNLQSNNSSKDNNKDKVERFLLPYLKKLSQDKLESFTKKEESYTMFKINLPLLIECKNIDKDHCKKEVIVDNSSVYRYYIKPYKINGKYYHICSQWADGVENSKNILKILSKIISEL